jgi:glycerol-3-phosphate dehydrogenase subunit B
MRTIVIGAGLAGLVTANRLAEGGAQVTLLSKGIGGLQLGQGTIDVLGYTPERVTNPIRSVQALTGSHPYGRIGADRVLTGLSYLKQLLPDLLVGDPEANYQLPTAVGAIRPTCLAQPSMVAGNLSGGDRVVIVGLRQLKDFHPQLVAENLARTELPSGGRAKVRHVLVDFGVREEVDTGALTYARALDDPATREGFARTVISHLETDEIVGLPAILGVRDANAWRNVAEKLGHPVFEIPLPPPSVPGIRLNEALTAKAKAAGVRFVQGTRTVTFRASGGKVEAVTSAVEPAGREFTADAFVLAGGGFESGALELDSHGRVRETLFGLPLEGADVTPLIHGDYWGGEQPLFNVGVAVGTDLKPLDASGAPVYSNLWAAGGIIAGSAGWAEKSGDGVALASAIGAADSILKELA